MGRVQVCKLLSPGAEQPVLGRRGHHFVHPWGRCRLPVEMTRQETWLFLPWPSLCQLSPHLQGHGGPMGSTWGPEKEAGEPSGCPHS